MVVGKFALNFFAAGFFARESCAEKTAEIATAGNGGEIVDATDQFPAGKRLKETNAKRGAANAASGKRDADQRRLVVDIVVGTADANLLGLRSAQSTWIGVINGI